MRILNGNPVLRLTQSGSDIHARVELSLLHHWDRNSAMLPDCPQDHTLDHQDREVLDEFSESLHPSAVMNPEFFMSILKLSRSFLLQCRPTPCSDPFVPLLTTAHLEGTAQNPSPIVRAARTGRSTVFRNPNGQIICRKKPKAERGWVMRIHLTKNTRRTPPPAGAPGAHFGWNKECTPKHDPAKVPSRRSPASLHRRAYRKWAREYKKECGRGVGTPNAAGPLPKKPAQSRAFWFKKFLCWQEHRRRRKKGRATNYPTTTPLSYGYKLGMATLNVQGSADTLKLKNSIQLLKEHNLDVLFLTETRPHSYYTYRCHHTSKDQALFA